MDEWEFKNEFLIEKINQSYDWLEVDEVEIDHRNFFSWHYANASLNIQAITWLKKNGKGCPHELIPNESWVEGPTDEDQDKAEAEWHRILDRMVLGFKALLIKEDFPEVAQIATEGMELYQKWYNQLWD